MTVHAAFSFPAAANDGHVGAHGGRTILRVTGSDLLAKTRRFPVNHVKFPSREIRKLAYVTSWSCVA
jgi:hypothetical protein